jgi:hypothetical protein
LNDGGQTGREIDIEQLVLDILKVEEEVREAKRFKK